ncbi:cytochrome c oxidase assembly protein [Williamsia sp. SKLECPSW1]
MSRFGMSATTPAVLAALGSGIALVVYSVVGGTTRFVETGDSYPGALTAGLAVVGYFVASAAGAVVLGALVFIVTCGRFGRDGVIGVGVYRAHRLVERLAPAWFVLAAVMIVVSASDRSGIPLSRVLSRPASVPTIVDANEQSVGWVVVTVIAAVVALSARFMLRWSSHVVFLIPATVGVVAVPVAGNAGQGPDHDYGTSAVLVFSVAVAVALGVRVCTTLCLQRDTEPGDRETVARRVRRIVTVADVVALVWGLILAVILVRPQDLLTTAFGRALVVMGAVLAVLVAGHVVDRVRGGDRSVDATAARAGIGAVAVIVLFAALAVADTRTATALLAHDFTGWDVYLGYELPHPPTVLRMITTWRFDVLIGAAAVAAGVLYVVGVIRLRRAGISWSPWRTMSWLIGCVGLLVVSSSGLRTYGMAMFSVHMVEHMTLNMFLPVVLVLGAPVTLALRALPTAPHGALPGPREWVTAMVHAPISRFLCHPVVALVIFIGSLYGVYFTPLFDTLVRYHWGHEAMSIHFLVTGYLFFWAIIGIDPGPRRLPFLARLGLLFAVMPFHAFFGIALMTMTSVIGGNFYRSVDLPWMNDLIHDQFLGGAIAWGASEAPVIVVIIALVAQWAQSDRRAGARADRHADTYRDDELEAYNAMLAELSRSRR